MNRSERAAQAFLDGYNCAQAVAVAFADLMGMEEKTAARLAAPFGGGMGRLREVCGAVSGMLLVLGSLYGYDDPKADGEKKQLYQEVQDLAAGFREQFGTILCRELLDNPSSSPNPTPRTPAFYQDRPCARFVAAAAEEMEHFIAAHPLENR